MQTALGSLDSTTPVVKYLHAQVAVNVDLKVLPVACLVLVAVIGILIFLPESLYFMSEGRGRSVVQK